MHAIRMRLALGIATLALALASGAANADCDFLTGGGFIIPNGANANFGVAGSCSNDGTFTWGHLEYIDHATSPSLNVHWTSITAYLREGTDGVDSKGRPTGTRFICGTARTNLPAPDDNVDFAVRARDTGEPGVTDEFDIQLTREGTQGAFIVYTTNRDFLFPPHQLNNGDGGGGNIQLHGTAGNFGGSCPARGVQA